MTLETDNEVAFEASKKRQRDLREAYVQLFGPVGHRTPLGGIVIDDLERFVRYGDRAITQDQTGRYDGGATAYNLGMQDVVKRIHLRINWSESHVNPSGNSSSPSPASGPDYTITE